MRRHKVDGTGQESVRYECAHCGREMWIDTEDGSEIPDPVVCVTCSEDAEE